VCPISRLSIASCNGFEDQTIDRAVGETVRRLHGGKRRGRKRIAVGVDATGLAQGAVSTFFVRRMHPHVQKPLPWGHWLKWLVVVDLDEQFILSQLARRSPWNDCGNLPAVVEAAAQDTRIGLVLADAEFDSERNHTYIREQLGARKENVASARSAGPDAAGLPARDLWSPRIKRECLLFGQKKALGSCARPRVVYADTQRLATRLGVQLL
jgi:hypothetical protein